MAKALASVFSPSDKESYYFFTKGDPKNPAICIIPGFTGLHSDLLPLAREFEDTHFVIVPELPGWGKSSPLDKKMTIANYAIYLKDLFTFLGITEVTFIGHCMGALITLEFCLLWPESVPQAFLVSTPYQDGMISKKIFLSLVHMSMHVPRRFRPLLYFWRNRLFNFVSSFIMLQSRSVRKKVRIILKGIYLQGLQKEEVVEDNWTSLITFPFSTIHGITTSLHLVHGGKDVIIPLSQAERLHMLLPSASFDVISNAGHLPPVETPKTLAKTIKKYL